MATLTPRLPPRNSRPAAPKYTPPRPRAPQPTVYRWGNSPTLAAASRKLSATKPPAYTPPAGAPAGAAAPAPTALPVDPAYDQQVGGLQRQRDTTLAGLTGERSRTLLDYGFTETPGTGQLAFDVNNPESRAAQMKKRYDQSRSGAGINMASRGQLYAGSYQNAQDALNQQQLSSEDQLQKALTGYLAGNTGRQTQARTDYELGTAGAMADRLGRAPANPLYSPTPETAGAPAAGGGGAAAPAGYTGPRGLVGGKYIDSQGGTHATTKKGGKTYYLAASGKWVAIG